MTPPDYIRSNPPELVSKFSDLSSPNTAGAADAAKESEAVLHEGEEVFAAYADMPPGCVECPLHDMPAHEKQIAQAMGFADTCESLADKPNKCPPGGCVQPTDGKFKVISGRTGKAWPSKFGSEKKAKAAIAAWHIKAGH